VHHIHADTAAGQLRDGAGGRESGDQDELDEFIVREVGAGIHQTAFNGLAADRGDIEAGAVIRKRITISLPSWLAWMRM